MDTGEGEIFKFSFATMLSCNDVIDLEGRRRRRADENVIERSRLPAALKQLALDRMQWNLLAVSTEILERTEQIVASHSVRTLDAIHIASAQEFAGQLRARVPFISADHRQIDAAVALGLIVERVV